MVLNICSFLLATLFVLSTDANSPFTRLPRQDFRLPLEVTPISYKVHLTPFLENATFDGRVEIATTPTTNLSEVRTITLHVHPNVTVKTADVLFHGKSHGVLKPLPRTNETNNFFVMVLGKPIAHRGSQEEAGSVVVVIEYSGLLNEEPKGFFRNFYNNSDGKTEYLAATHFEPVKARMAFPCFDEPALKARFELTVTAPSGYSVLSNTPTVGPPTNDALGRPVFTFKQTPPMSTYLVATVVSKFESTPSTSTSHVLWSKPNTESQRKYGAKYVAPVMDALVEFTGMPYEIGNITKMDNVAVPGMFSGAMENWGLVTYRPEYLLVEEIETPFNMKRKVVGTIAHEYAHQFFGNIVSPAWWNVLWLNEGFANYFQYHIKAMVEPTWREKEYFVLYEVHDALKIDSLGNMDPLTMDEDDRLHPKELETMFNTITYSKGGSFVRMMEHVLGTDVFRAGLQKYLKKMYLKVAKEDDLFDTLAETAGNMSLDGFSLQEFLKSWTRNAGYPLLTVTRDYEAGTAKATQERFLLFDKPSSSPAWITPVNWATNYEEFNDTKPTAWLKTTETLQFPSVAGRKQQFNASSWIVVNNQRTGFYRVNYDDDNWQLLIQQLLEDCSVFPLLTRAQLLNDAFALSENGKLNYTVTLGLTRYLENQNDNIPLLTAVKGLTFISNGLSRSPYYPYYKSYVSKLLKPKAMKLLDPANYKSVSNEDKLLLETVTRWSPEIVANLTGKMAATTLGSGGIPADYRYPVYCTHIRAGGPQVWKDYWQRYLTTNIESEKSILLKALACSEDQEILYQYLLKTTAPDFGVRKKDVYRFVCNNPVAFDVLLKFLDDHIDVARKEKLENVVNELAEMVADKDQGQKFLAVAEKLDMKMKPTVDKKLKWIQDNEETVGQWFKRHSDLTEE